MRDVIGIFNSEAQNHNPNPNPNPKITVIYAVKLPNVLLYQIFL